MAPKQEAPTPFPKTENFYARFLSKRFARVLDALLDFDNRVGTRRHLILEFHAGRELVTLRLDQLEDFRDRRGALPPGQILAGLRRASIRPLLTRRSVFEVDAGDSAHVRI